MRMRRRNSGRLSTAGLVAAALLISLPVVTGGPTVPVASVADDATAEAALGSPSSDFSDSLPATNDPADYTQAVAAAPEPSAPVISSPGGATPVRLTENSKLCGPGNTQVELIGKDSSVSCVHTLADPQPTRTAKKGAIRMDPICYGNGTNGARIQFMYVFIEGRPNRFAQFAPLMLKSWIPAMEGSFRSTSKEHGREIGMRVFMPDCKIDIGVVMMSAEDGTPDNAGAMAGRVEAAIKAAGFSDDNRKYHAWFDGDNDSGACGVAPFTGLDQPGPANLNNLGTQPIDVFGQVAVTFRLPFALPDHVDVNASPACFGSGAMGATTETHELLHVLGAVNYSSPNSNGLGHCKDDVDIMCYSEGGVQTVLRCASEFELLDCGSDDYFNARPQLGTYLSTHWNTATSRFLGPSPEDDAYSTLPL